MVYYKIADRFNNDLTKEDAKSLGIDIKDVTVWGKKVCSLSHDGDVVVVMAKKQLDSYLSDQHYKFRDPLEGEWFISGEEPEAYKSTCDLSTSFHIAELVLVKTITITTQVEVTL